MNDFKTGFKTSLEMQPLKTEEPSLIHSFCLKHSHVKYDCLLLLA